VVEHLRYFKASFEADSNKKTVRRTFELQHYEALDDMIESMQRFFESFEDGVMDGEWEEYSF